MNRIFYYSFVPEIFYIDIRQYHPDYHHGHGGITVSQCRHHAVQSRRKLDVCKHKDNSQNAGQNTGMGQNLFQCLFFVAGTGKDCQAGGPHHDPLRDQIDACQHKPLRSVNAFCYWISQKTRIRADRSVSETFLPSFRFLTKCYFPIYYAKCLDKYRNDQNFQIR